MLLVLATYIVSVSVTETRAASIVLTVQLATVWVTLRTSQARRVIRRIADVVPCLVGAVAVVSFFAHNPGDQLGGVFAVCCLLYPIAPFSIVRHLVLRQDIGMPGARAMMILLAPWWRSPMRCWPGCLSTSHTKP